MTNEEVENLPDHVKAAAFAVHQYGSVADGITATHVIAVISWLQTAGYNDGSLGAHVGLAYDRLLAEQAAMQ